MNARDDDRVRELLHGAVSEVEPGYGLDAIRSRTRGSTRRTWVWGALGAAVATAATVAAVVALVGLPGTGDPGPGPVAGSPTPTRSENQAPVYFVGDTGVGPRLFSEPHLVSSDDAAVQTAVLGGTFDPDYRSLWPDATAVEDVTSGSAVDTVRLSGEADLTTRPATMSAAEARLSIQQLVLTTQSVLGGARPVVFTLDGTRTNRLLGVDVSDPTPADNPDDVLAPVSISEPQQQSDPTLGPLSSPVSVTGRAAAFEGTVVWELTQGDRVVEHGFATTQVCCTLSPFSFEVSAPAGDYTLVVHDEDVSDGEGFPPSQDTKEISIG